MLITVITDTHFNAPYHFSSIDEEGYNTRFTDQLSVFDLIAPNTDTLVHIGDMFHSKFNVSHLIYNKVYKEFDEAPGRFKIIVTGNHDYYEYGKTANKLQKKS